VTEIKKLENVRRDFVANVSHELKTPITAVQGYVETLLDGTRHQRRGGFDRGHPSRIVFAQREASGNLGNLARPRLNNCFATT